MTPPWWACIEPVAVQQPCGGAVHEVRWHRGRLDLLDHADLEAEGALRALGGELPPCLELRAAWDRHAADPSVVTLGRRPSEPTIGFSRPPLGTDAGRRRDLLVLFSLPPPMIDRLVLGAMAAADDAWSQASFRDDHGLRLGSALASRATPALRRLGGELAGPEESLSVYCIPSGAGVPATVLAERSDTGLEVTASLPLSWLTSVWGAGMSEPEGRFVLSVTGDLGRGRFDVVLATWERSGVDQWEAAPQSAVVHRDPDGAWRILPGDPSNQNSSGTIPPKA